MRIESEDQGVVLDESTNEVAKQRKRRNVYTRTFLLSFSDRETRKLPSDLDSSILQYDQTCTYAELYDDVSIGSLERPRSECSMSLCSSDSSEYGPLQSLKGNDSAFPELFNKCDGHSPWLKNKGSNSQRNSNPEEDNCSQESSSKLVGHSLWPKSKDSHLEYNRDPYFERSCGDRYQFLSQNPDNDGLLQTPDFSRVTASIAAVSAPVVQGHYLLKKCDNPYRPPHMYKAKNDEVNDTLNSGKDSTVVSFSNEQKSQKRSVKQPTASEQQDETESIYDSLINMSNSTMNSLSYDEISEHLDYSSQSSFGAINESDAADQGNEFTDRGADQVAGGMTIGISDQQYAGLALKELSFGEIEVESGTSAIISKKYIVEADNTLGLTLHCNQTPPSLLEVEQPILSEGHGSSSTWNHPAKEQLTEMEYEWLNFANSVIFSEQSMGFSLRTHSKEIERQNISIQLITRDTETQKVTLGMDFLKEHSSDEPPFSIQIGSFDPNKRQENLKPCGTNFQDVDDDLLISILDNCGAFEMCDEDIRAINFSLGTEINETEDDQSEYEEIWDKILSVLKTEQESESSPLALSDKTTDSEGKACYLLDEDNLIAINSTIVHDGSKFVSNAALVLPTEEEPILPPCLDPDKIAEIDLPDEDSLITIEDLIAPLSLESLKIENIVKTDQFTSEVVPNENSTVRHHSPTDHVQLQKSRQRSLESQMKSGQTQLSSQISFRDPKTDQDHTPPPVCCSFEDEHSLSWKTLAAKPSIFGNTICYSVLEQPRNLHQQSQLHKSVAFPDCVNQLGCYKHELYTTYLYPLNYQKTGYQGSGMPNPDFCRFGGNISHVIANGFVGTNLEARPMHQLCQDRSNQPTSEFL